MEKLNTVLDGISFEENFFENETPDETKFYDLDGNEVKFNVNE